MGCTQGYGSFNLLLGKGYCRMCGELTEPAACVFLSCAWMYDGRKLGSDGQLQYCHSDWQVSSVQAS